MQQRIIQVVKAEPEGQRIVQVERKQLPESAITGIETSGANGRILAAEGKSQNQILKELRQQKLELQKNGYDLTRKKIGARL